MKVYLSIKVYNHKNEVIFERVLSDVSIFVFRFSETVAVMHELFPACKYVTFETTLNRE